VVVVEPPPPGAPALLGPPLCDPLFCDPLFCDPLFCDPVCAAIVDGSPLCNAIGEPAA
jgi:hypothetical protein